MAATVNTTPHSSERRHRLAVALLCVVLSALAVVPFYWLGQPLPGGSRHDFRMPVTHDMFEHYDQMRDFYRGLASGEIYPRWEEDTNSGFGAPTTSFYPPGVYYLTSALYPLLRDWLRVLLAAHLLMMIASAAAIYWLARRSMSRLAAAVAMAAYIILPYHLADQYHREAIAELLAFVWMPLMLGCADELLSEPQRRAQTELAIAGAKAGLRARLARPALLAAGLGAAYGAFLWSHPPTAYQFTLAFVLFVPLLAALRRNWCGLAWIGGGLALGLGLSAAYLLPAALEANFIRQEVVEQTWPYRNSYLFQGAAFTQPYPEFFAALHSAWWLGLLGSFVIALLFVVLVPKETASVGAPQRLRSNVAFWAALSCFASFMMLRQSDWLGSRIPKLEIGVFSWRMLSITTLAVALLAGAATQAALDARRTRSNARSTVFAALAAAMLLAAGWISLFQTILPVNAFAAFQPPEAHMNYAIVPRAAPCPDDLPEMNRAVAHAAGASVSIAEWKPQHRVLGVKVPQADPLLIRTFNYPGWSAHLDGRPIPLGTDSATGAIVVYVPPGEHVVTLDFVDTPARRLGTAITLLSATGLLVALAGGPAPRKPSQAR